MAFRIMARTILELGAELISSDGVAIYELIKNAIDAGSKRVNINVVVALTRSDYEQLLDRVDARGGSFEHIVARVTAEVSGSHLVNLPQETLDDLLKRMKAATNADGARAALDAWYAHFNYVRVSDTGDGMSIADLEDVFLTIGTRSRQLGKATFVSTSENDHPPLGEKGVGRLSTMRLGDTLQVRTTKAGEQHVNNLDVDWSLFSHESDKLLEEVKVEPTLGKKKQDPAYKGTSITIRHLLSDWSAQKLEEIAGEEFARLVDPFEGETANRILRLSFNGEAVAIPEIEQDYLDLAHGTLTAEYSIVDGRPVLKGVSNYVLRGKKLPFSLNATDLLSVAKPATLGLLRDVGPFKVDMWWYNRRILKAVEGLGTRSDILHEINRWSGGLMLFRDGFRVNPYGGGSDDWLQLDRKAFASRGFKLNRQQVVGRVRISWRNKGLRDQTNREGLTDTPEKRAFVAMLQALLLTEFKRFIDREDKAARMSEKTTMDNIEEKIETTETEIKSKLGEIKRLADPRASALAQRAEALVKQLTSYLAEAKALADEVESDRAQLVHLAGVGLMVEFVMHELERVTTATLSTLRDIDEASLTGATASAMTVLSDQLVTLNKRVANLDPMSAARRQTKERFAIGETLFQIIEGRSAQIKRHGVDVRGNFMDGATWMVTGVRGMFIQIIENLLSNSLYWLKYQQKLEPDFKPVVTIDIDQAEGVVMVTDNGPGVDPEMAQEIFKPFFTRRPAGEGHGLGLYISREVAAYHGWTLDIERAETTRPGRYNTFVLDLTG